MGIALMPGVEPSKRKERPGDWWAVLPSSSADFASGSQSPLGERRIQVEPRKRQTKRRLTVEPAARRQNDVVVLRSAEPGRRDFTRSSQAAPRLISPIIPIQPLAKPAFVRGGLLLVALPSRVIAQRFRILDNAAHDKGIPAAPVFFPSAR